MTDEDSRYTECVCADGAVILKDGNPVPIAAILEALHERDELRSNYETAQANWDLTLDRAEAAEAERDELQARVTELEDLMASANDSIQELHFSEQEATAALAEALEVVRKCRSKFRVDAMCLRKEGTPSAAEQAKDADGWVRLCSDFLAKYGGDDAE